MSFWTPDCPELEIRHTPLEENYSALNPGIETSIDLLEIRSSSVQSLEDPGVVYKRNLGHEELVEHLDHVDPQHQANSRPLLRILFIKACGPGNASNLDNIELETVRPAISSTTLDYLVRRLRLSPLIIQGLTGNLWRKMGNCQRNRMASTEPDEAIEGWYRYSCGMKGFPSYTWFSYTRDSATYVVNNCERHGVLDRILRCIQEGFGGTLLRPLALDAFISEATSEAWAAEMNERRRVLVEHERMNRNIPKLDTSGSVESLHRLSRHLLVIKEDMTDLIERVEFLVQVHSSLSHLVNRTYPGVPVSQSLSFLLSQTRILRRWVHSYADRTAIQINLLYNLSAQRDNRTNLMIAEFTSKIATEAQKDSTSMITMSTVTMLFLPGTFVSAIFSMVFFNPAVEPTGGGTYLTVSRGWWLYPAITIPLTAIVFLVWSTWKTRRKQQLEELKGLPSPPMHDSPGRVI